MGGWEGSGGIRGVGRSGSGCESPGKVVYSDVLAFRKGVSGEVGEVEVGSDLLGTDSEGEEGVKVLEFI